MEELFPFGSGKTNKKTTLLLQEIWNEAKCKAKQSKGKENHETLANFVKGKKSSSSKQAKQSKASKQKGVLWSLAKNRVSLS